MKRLFVYNKVGYRGLMKKTQRLVLLLGLGNLLTAEGQVRGVVCLRQFPLASKPAPSRQ